jgi:NAD(P)-dependent dehydrogenase (short-subunit alcohol dehydrogenase family)
MSRVALVTGAAGGIGRATADELERRGYRVARNHLPGQVVEGHSAPADVSDPGQVEAMVAGVAERLGPVEVLVANAADMVMGAIDEVEETAFWRVIHTNLTGAFSCVRACLPHMRSRGFGRIVHVTSEWGQTGWPRATAYSASKAGLISLTKALARELGPLGITVNAVAPGVIDTPQLEVDARDAGVPLEQMKERYAAQVPLGRIGGPAEVASAIAHLIGEGAATITGQVLAVNGGTTR